MSRFSDLRTGGRQGQAGTIYELSDEPPELYGLGAQLTSVMAKRTSS